MTISFEIKNEFKKDYKKETEKYINLIEKLKTEREDLLKRHANAYFGGDSVTANIYALRITANSLLADAYKLGLKALQMEMEV